MEKIKLFSYNNSQTWIFTVIKEVKLPVPNLLNVEDPGLRANRIFMVRLNHDNHTATADIFQLDSTRWKLRNEGFKVMEPEKFYINDALEYLKHFLSTTRY